MRTRAQIEADLRTANPTSDGNGTGHPDYEALITKWTDNQEVEEAKNEILTMTESFISDFKSLDADVRGPFRPLVNAILEMLREGDYDGAIQALTAQSVPAKFTAKKAEYLANFSTMKTIAATLP